MTEVLPAILEEVAAPVILAAFFPLGDCFAAARILAFAFAVTEAVCTTEAAPALLGPRPTNFAATAFFNCDAV